MEQDLVLDVTVLIALEGREEHHLAVVGLLASHSILYGGILGKT